VGICSCYWELEINLIDRDVPVYSLFFPFLLRNLFLYKFPT
jgi:hypothetical protein